MAAPDPDAAPEPIRLGFTGDVMLGRLVDERQRRRDVHAVWGDMLDRLRALDGLFVNLECCLSTRGEPWTRTDRPFHFRADPSWAIPALEAAGVDYAGLANNHAMDYEVPALLDTLDALEEADIAHTGAGRDADSAWAPAIVDLEVPVSVEGNRLRVAVVAVTDNTPEFAAGPDEPGTAYAKCEPADEDTREHVAAAIEAAQGHDPDLLVASIHWGPNMVTEPFESHQNLARWLTEAGVDLVHGHSAHVLQGVAVVEGTPVCFDLGDFVDDYAVDADLRNDLGALCTVSVSATGEVQSLRFTPTEIYDFAVHEAEPRAASMVREFLETRSAPFGTNFERDGEDLVLELP